MIPPNPCYGLPNGIFITNPKGCEFFFYCHNSQALEAKCPGDLWFDVDSGICEKSENVDCTLNLIKPPTLPPNTLGEPVHCPNRDSVNDITFIASNVDCGRYYICYHSMPLRQQCIAGLHWNPTIMKCDHPKSAKCRVSTIRYSEHAQIYNPYLYILA